MKKLIILNILFVLLLYRLPAAEVEQFNTVVNGCEQVRPLANTCEQVTSRSLEEPRKNHIVANNKMLVESDKIDFKATKISQEGINLIKQFEGLKLHSYRLQGEDFNTIRIWTHRGRC